MLTRSETKVAKENGHGNLAGVTVHNVNVPDQEGYLDALALEKRDLDWIDNRITKDPKNIPMSLQEEKTRIRNLISAIQNSIAFGKIVATSGFRSIASGGAQWPVDWALVEITNDKGSSNKVRIAFSPI